VWARLDEVDDAEQEDRPAAELEHVADFNRRRNVASGSQWARLDSNQGPTDYESAALTS